MTPSEERTLEEVVPPDATRIGLVADYFIGAEGAYGTRKLIVNTGCGSQTPRILLMRSQMLRE